MYESGAKIREIADALGCSDTSIYWNLDKAGVRRRTASGPRKIDDAKAIEIRKDYEADMTIKDLCAKYEVGKKTITRAVLQAGGKMRSRQQSLDISVGSNIERRKLIADEYGDEIVRLYTDEQMSQTAIGERLGISQAIVSRVIRNRGVQKPAPSGSRAPGWRGGRIRNPYGYISVIVDESDPIAVAMRNANGYVLEHRLVVARAVGRPLRPDETVHHINGRRDDNRIGNLQLRQGRHGRGAALVCGDCGSHNIIGQELPDAPLYHCAACGTPAIETNGTVERECDCDAPILADGAASTTR